VNKGNEEALQAEKKRLEHERRARQQASGRADRDMGQELAGHCGERMEGKWSCCLAEAEDAPPCLRSSVRAGIRFYSSLFPSGYYVGACYDNFSSLC